MTRKEASAIVTAVNDGFTDELKRAFEGKFKVEVQSDYSIFTFGYITTRIDGQDFTQDQADFIAAFEVGYSAATMKLRTAVE